MYIFESNVPVAHTSIHRVVVLVGVLSCKLSGLTIVRNYDTAEQNTSTRVWLNVILKADFAINSLSCHEPKGIPAQVSTLGETFPGVILHRCAEQCVRFRSTE